VFCNPKYITNIRESNYPLSISTNGGQLKITQKGYYFFVCPA
jgi:hypothetical protein